MSMTEGDNRITATVSDTAEVSAGITREISIETIREYLNEK